MSIGRPDAYASKFISPEEYNRNRVSIEVAHAKLEEFAKMNEIGRMNYEAMEQEELELSRKIQEGELAKQRLQQLKQRKSLAITNGDIGSSSRPENVGSSRVVHNSIPYPQSLSHPKSQPQPNHPYGGPSYHPHSNHVQQPIYYALPQPYPGPVNFNNIPQNQNFTQHAQQQPVASTYRHPPSGQKPGGAPPTNGKSYTTQDPKESNSAGAFGNDVSTPQSTSSSSRDSLQNLETPLPYALPSPLLDILMPANPTVAQLQNVKHYLNQWASAVPPLTKYEAMIIWDTYRIKCYKNKDSALIFSIETPTGLVEAVAHGILDDLIAKANASQATSGVHDSLSTNNTQPSLAASSSTRQGQTTPAAPQAMFSISRTLRQHATHPYVPHSVSPSTHVRESTQATSSLAPAVIPSSIVANQPTPSQEPLAPVAQTTQEQSNTHVTPKQADKKRIAQSLLWALGKRPRESTSDSESQSSKKRAIDTVNGGRPISVEAQTASAPSKPIDSTGSANSQNQANSFVVLQKPAQSHGAGTVLKTSTQPPATSSHLPQSNMRPVSTTPKYYPNAGYQTVGASGQPQTIVPDKSHLGSLAYYRPQNPPISHNVASVPVASTSQQIHGHTSSKSTEVSSGVTRQHTVKTTKAPSSETLNVGPSISDDQKKGSPSVRPPTPPRLAVSSRPSEKASHGQDPLFLPSPSPEPRQDEMSVSTDTKTPKVTRRVKHRAYVLVPSAPDYVVRYHKQLRRKQSKALRDKQDAVALPDPVVEEEDFWYTFESQRGSPSDENEREAIKLACSRLHPSPCKWDGCGAIMNSGEALIRHLSLHKPEPTQNVRTFMCRWTQCGQQGVRFEDSQHLKKHALLPLRCAYTGCKDSFRSASQLCNHFRRRHANGTLKPSAKPELPSKEVAVLPKIPPPFPSYLLSMDLARGEVLSDERHRLVGQQVLMNITFVDDGAPIKRRSKKTARPATLALPDPTAHLTSDYQFLLNKDSARSSTYFSKACDIDHDDLDSAQISRMIKQGIVLWGSDSEADGGTAEAVSVVPESSLFSSEPTQPVLDAEIKLEAETGAEPGFDRSDSASMVRQPRFDELHISDVEDAAVENMLTDIDVDQTLNS